MSKKQEIYAELLSLCIPYTRGVLTRIFVFGKVRREAYELCQLSHNLYVSILEEEFVDHDIRFLNHQAKSFYENTRGMFFCDRINKLIVELFKLVPEKRKIELEWDGSNEP